MSSALLKVERLRVGFPGAGGGLIEAVRGVDFAVAPGEAVGIVGESGSGKSLTMFAVMRVWLRSGAAEPSTIFRCSSASQVTSWLRCASLFASE